MGLSLLILPSLLGIDSIVKFVLDTKLFNFIAKTSYCTYLVHLIVITYICTNRKIDFYYDLLSSFSTYLRSGHIFYLKLGIRKCNMTGFIIFCHLKMHFLL